MRPVQSTVEPSLELDVRLELETVYRSHSAAVSRWIRRLWGPSSGESSADAEDLLHEVFLVVQRRLDGFRAESALSTWLYGITVRVVTARRRKDRLRRLLWVRAEPELMADGAEQADSEHDRSEAARVVYTVLDALGERDRTLLILFELEQLPGAQVAEILGMSERNLWVALSRARARFKHGFERRYGDAEPAKGTNHG